MTHVPCINETGYATKGYWWKCSCGDSGSARNSVDDALADWEVHRAENAEVWRVCINVKGSKTRSQVLGALGRGFARMMVGDPLVFKVKRD